MARDFSLNWHRSPPHSTGKLCSVWDGTNDGNFVEGQPFTLNGAGFGTKIGISDHINSSGIFSLQDYPDNSNFGNIGNWSGENFIGASNRPTLKSSGGINGQRFLQSFQNVFGAAGRQPNNCIKWEPPTALQLGQKAIITYYAKHYCPDKVTGGQIKTIRVCAVNNSLSDKINEYYHNSRDQIGGEDDKFQMRNDTYVPGAGTNDVTVHTGGGSETKLNSGNRWMRFEHHIDMPLDISNSFKLFYRAYDCFGGGTKTERILTNFSTPNGFFPFNTNLPMIVLWQFFFGNGDYGSCQHWISSCQHFVSWGDRKRVVITDKPSFSQAGIRKFEQIPGNSVNSSWWTDTSINIVVNKCGLPKGYVWTVDDDDIATLRGTFSGNTFIAV